MVCRCVCLAGIAFIPLSVGIVMASSIIVTYVVTIVKPNSTVNAFFPYIR